MNVDVTAFKAAIDVAITNKVADNSIFPVHVGGGINNLADLVKIFFTDARTTVEKSYTEEEINANGDLDLIDDLPPVGAKLLCAYVVRAGTETPVNSLYNRDAQVATNFGDWIELTDLQINLTFIY